MFSFLSSEKPKTLTGSYPGGLNSFCCSFPKSKIGDLRKSNNFLSESVAVGNINWHVVLKNVGDQNNNSLKIELKCIPENKLKGWNVVADYIILVTHPVDKTKDHLLGDSTELFDENTNASHKVNDTLIDSKKYVDENLMITFQFQIGVKSTNLSKSPTDYTVSIIRDDISLVVGATKFYTRKESLIKAADGFEKLIYNLPPGHQELVIENSTPEIFHVFLRILFTSIFTIEFKMIDELMNLKKRFNAKYIQTECEKFLENMVEDEAELIRLADKHGMDSVIKKRIVSMNSLESLAKGFKYYRRFSHSTMKILVNKFLEMP